MFHILILNLNKPKLTISCIRSIENSTYKKFQIYLLDNGSESENDELISLKNIQYFRSGKNLGFAGGNNYLLEKIIPNAKDKDIIIFLNNDTEIDKNLLEQITKNISFKNKKEIVTTRMMKLNQKDQVNNLGNILNKSFIGKARLSKKEVLFASCGGCTAYTVNSLKEIKKATGDYFDPDYFCYCEDIDLGFRALLLGFKNIYIDDAICFHEVGATSGKSFNKFIMYHTLRNSLYNLVKNMPGKLLVKYFLHIFIFQVALIFRYIFTKKSPTILKVYLDFFKHLPKLLRKRKKIQKNLKISYLELEKYFDPSFITKTIQIPH